MEIPQQLTLPHAPLMGGNPDRSNVRVVGCAYLVDLGQADRPRWHTVHKDRSCQCGDPACPAVQKVAEQLRSGQIERAPDPPHGYTAFLPRACPLCGSTVVADYSLSSRRRGIGWKCIIGGRAHYWLHQWEAVKDWFFREEILPGLYRTDFAMTGPMGYLPAANRCEAAFHDVKTDDLELCIQPTDAANCGDPRSPSGHVWSSAVIPPPDDLPCLCGQVTWGRGVRLAYARRTREQPLSPGSAAKGVQP